MWQLVLTRVSASADLCGTALAQVAASGNTCTRESVETIVFLKQNFVKFNFAMKYNDKIYDKKFIILII